MFHPRGSSLIIEGIFTKIYEILVKIWEIFEPISGIVREIYGVFKAIFGIARKIERVLKEMHGVSLPISRIACKPREISTMILGVVSDFRGLPETHWRRNVEALHSSGAVPAPMSQRDMAGNGGQCA